MDIDPLLIIDCDKDPAWEKFWESCRSTNTTHYAEHFHEVLTAFNIKVHKSTVYFSSMEELVRFRLIYG